MLLLIFLCSTVAVVVEGVSLIMLLPLVVYVLDSIRMVVVLSVPVGVSASRMVVEEVVSLWTSCTWLGLRVILLVVDSSRCRSRVVGSMVCVVGSAAVVRIWCSVLRMVGEV